MLAMIQNEDHEVPEIATAYHEAGHAVVQWHFGLPIFTVTIIPEGDSLGSVAHPPITMIDMPASRRERRAAARQMILACFAGLHAERLIRPDAEEWRGQSDDDNAFDLSVEHGLLPRSCGHVGDESHLAYLDRMKRESGRLVQHGTVTSHPEILLTQLIRELAEELVRRKTMTGNEVDEFFEKAMKKR